MVHLDPSDDGCIMLHDSRADNRTTRAQSTVQHDTEFTDVKFHPLAEHLFATSDSHGKVCLRDSRMAFGPLVNRTREGIVRVVSIAVMVVYAIRDRLCMFLQVQHKTFEKRRQPPQ